MSVIKKYFFLLIVILFFTIACYAQPVSNVRQHYISTKIDSIKIDTLSIISGSFFIVTDAGVFLDSTTYSIDYANAVLRWKKNTSAFSEIKADSVKAVYRLFPVLFTQSYTHKEKRIIETWRDP